jgi:hypothetical protein
MTAARAWMRVGIATLFLAASAAFAGDVKYDVGDQVLVVNIDGNLDEVDVTDLDRDAIGFQMSNGMMRWLFVPTANSRGKKISESALRTQTNDLRREIQSQGGEASEDLLEIKGGQVSGYYIKGIDSDAGSDEWEFVYTGFVLVGETLPVMFNIVWDKGAEGAANRALSAVRGMRLAKN